MQEIDFVGEVLCNECSWRLICLTACKEVNEALVRIEETFAQELQRRMQQMGTKNKGDVSGTTSSSMCRPPLPPGNGRRSTLTGGCGTA